MHPLQEILDGVVTKHRWQRATTLLAIQSLWKSALGPPLCDSTRPWSFNRGILTVAVPSPVWTQELMYMRESLMARVNQQLEGDSIKELRFIVRAWNREPSLHPDGGQQTRDVATRLKTLADQLRTSIDIKGGMEGENRRE